MSQPRTHRVPGLLLVLVAAAIGLAACGSSSPSTSTAAAGAGASTTTSSGAGRFDRSKFAACLKAHGVTLPARPARPGGSHPPGSGYGFGGGAGVFGGGAGGSDGGPGGRFSNPKFRAALQACGGGRGFTRRRPGVAPAAVTKFTACVKQHGYDLPAPNFSDKGPIFPARIARDPKFQAAAKPCVADLRPAGAPGSGAGGGGGAPPAGSGSTSSA